MTRKLVARTRIGLLLILLCPLMLCIRPASAQEEAQELTKEQIIDREFAFIAWLVDVRLPDYADKALAELVKRYPTVKKRAQVSDAQILLARNKVEEVKKIIDGMSPTNPKTQAIRLNLAKWYFARGKKPEAKKIFKEIMNQLKGKPISDTDLKLQFTEASWILGGMLKDEGDFKSAVNVYKTALTVKQDRFLERKLKMTQAHTYVDWGRTLKGSDQKSKLTAADKVCEDLLWIQDIFFGQAIACKVDIMLVQGKQAEAIKFLDEYYDIISKLDKMLRENDADSESPMAHIRFIKGGIFFDQARAAFKASKKEEGEQLSIKAATQFYNTFIKYAGSTWSSKAALKYDAVDVLLFENIGKHLRPIALKPAQLRQIYEAQQQIADKLRRDGQNASAAEKYLSLLNQFPETEYSPATLSNLALSLAAEGQTNEVLALVGYVGDRFSKNPEAAKVLQRIGGRYLDQKNPKKNQGVYFAAFEQLAESFPEDSYAPSSLFVLGRIMDAQGNEAGMHKYYMQLVERYPEHMYAPKAMGKIAFIDYENENFASAVTNFTRYLEIAAPGYDKAQGMFGLANSLSRQNQNVEAVAAFKALKAEIDPQRQDSPYKGDKDLEDKIKTLREDALFFYPLAMLKFPSDHPEVNAYRQKAIAECEFYIKEFPKSENAPRAMQVIGRAHIAMGQTREASEVFNKLSETYPDTPEGKDALYSLVKAAMDEDAREIAEDAVGKMLAKPEAYSPDQLIRVGMLMQKHEIYEPCEKLMTLVVKQVDKELGQNNAMSKADADKWKTYEQRALYGLGLSANEQGKFPAAIEAINSLVTKHPKSGLLFDALFVKATASRETGDFDGARAALGQIQSVVNSMEKKQPIHVHRPSYEAGLIEAKAGEDLKALNYFFKLVDLAPHKDKDIGPLVKRGIDEGIQAATRAERWAYVADMANYYLQKWPAGPRAAEMRKTFNSAKLKAQE